jgi:MerR family mercuric resistance operon transcriptional regulator
MGKKSTASVPKSSSSGAFTVGRLAEAAGVGVETIRYYQSRGLLRVPGTRGTYRVYPHSAVQRIAFIKRAQTLGFNLDEVGTLLDLEDGRNRRAVQAVTVARLRQIESKLADLGRMQEALSELLELCRQAGSAQSCPIIESLTGVSVPT